MLRFLPIQRNCQPKIRIQRPKKSSFSSFESVIRSLGSHGKPKFVKKIIKKKDNMAPKGPTYYEKSSLYNGKKLEGYEIADNDKIQLSKKQIANFLGLSLKNIKSSRKTGKKSKSAKKTKTEKKDKSAKKTKTEKKDKSAKKTGKKKTKTTKKTGKKK